MLELWKETLEKGKSVGAIFMGLSKAFDTLNYDFLIAKLEAYGFSENSLNYIQSYYAIVNKEQIRIIISVHGKIFFCCSTRIFTRPLNV